jgi:hypothetical protein
VTTTPGSRLLAAALFCLTGCSPAGRASAGDIAITLEPARASTAAFVRVSGLSAEEASQFGSAALVVNVQGADVAVVGRTVANGPMLEFHPTFPFDPGRPYVVRLDTSRWPTSRRPAVAEAVVSLPAPAATVRVAVTSIRPSQNRWPENTLRFYIHFSGPMSNDSTAGKVHLVGEDGEDIADALLPLNVDLWNEDRTRFTVLFDPARVKRGVLSNREMGRALNSGRSYAIVVDADWRDASGRALASTYRHEFTAGPARELGINPSAWRLTVPNAGTQDRLVVQFPYALDSALLLRAIEVISDDRGAVSGTVDVRHDATAWEFIPSRAWESRRHHLRVAPFLEDPAGNRVNRPFELDPAKSAAAEDATPAVVPFLVK